MKEMQYQKIRYTTILDKGDYKGFNYAIVSYGTHPCCYVFLPKGHKYYGKEYDDIEISCHGGLTFSEKDLAFNPIFLKDTWVIGWDYAHCDDYAGYFEDNGDLAKNTKKWTTKEMQKEVFGVIEQLIESEV